MDLVARDEACVRVRAACEGGEQALAHLEAPTDHGRADGRRCGGGRPGGPFAGTTARPMARPAAGPADGSWTCRAQHLAALPSPSWPCPAARHRRARRIDGVELGEAHTDLREQPRRGEVGERRARAAVQADGCARPLPLLRRRYARLIRQDGGLSKARITNPPKK